MPVANQHFHVFMYEDELNYLKGLVLQKPKIETGGDLFGLWQNDHTAVVQLIIGPGEGCSRTQTSFHQDVKYLGDVGKYLATSQGLCNIGAWHSHHTIGLFEPSGGDKKTVWDHMCDVPGGRFLIFIANIKGPKEKPEVSVGCFVFNYANRKIVVGEIKRLPTSSALRDVLNEEHLKTGSELNQDWETVLANRNVSTPCRSERSKQPEVCERMSEMEDVDESSKVANQDGDDNEETRPILEANNEKEKMGKCRRFKMFLYRICCCIFFCCERSQEVQ